MDSQWWVWHCNVEKVWIDLNIQCPSSSRRRCRHSHSYVLWLSKSFKYPPHARVLLYLLNFLQEILKTMLTLSYAHITVLKSLCHKYSLMWGQKTCVRCQGTNCCSIGTAAAAAAAGPEWRNMRDIVPVCHQHLFVRSWPNRLNWQRVQWRHVVTSLWAPLPNFFGRQVVSN